LKEHLQEGGTCQIFTEVLIREGKDYLQKLYSTLRDLSYDILVLSGNHIPPELYVINHLKYRLDASTYRRDLVEWLDCIYSTGIKEVGEGVITARKIPGTSSPASAFLRYRIPNRPFWKELNTYLVNLRASSAKSDISARIPVLNDEVHRLWQGASLQGKKAYLVEFRETGLPLETPITREESLVIRYCDGKKNSREIAENACRSLSRLNPEVSRVHVLGYIKTLLRKQILSLRKKKAPLDIINSVFLLILCLCPEWMPGLLPALEPAFL